MKPFYLLLTVLNFVSFAYTQQLSPAIEWQKCLGGTRDEKANSIIKAVDNGFIVAGYTKSNDGDLTAHYGSLDSMDAWVVKLSATGDIEWKRNYGGDGEDVFNTIIRTNDDNYICYGYTTSNNGDVSGKHGDWDIWVVKIDRHGNILWQKCYGGSLRETPGNIKQNTDGSFYMMATTVSNDGDVSGLHGGSGARSDAWACKISASGGLLMQRCWGGTLTDMGYDLIETENGGYFITGASDSRDGDFSYIFGGNGPIPIVAKTDGNAIVRTWDYGQRGKALSITATEPNKYVVSTRSTPCYPYTNDAVGFSEIFDDPNSTGQTAGSRGIGFSKCDGNGGYGGPRYTGGGPSSYLQVNATENIATVSYWPEINYPSPIGNVDPVITGFNTGGGSSWTKSIGGSGRDELHSLALDNEFEFVIAGFTGSNDGDVSGNHGGFDIWVVKLGRVNLVNGTIFADYNSNGTKEANEPFVNNLLVQTQKGNSQSGSLSIGGRFSNFVDTGNFTTQVTTNVLYHTVVPVSIPSSFSTYNNTNTISFAVQPIPGKRDYEINVYSLGPVRPGFDAWYSIVYRNMGTDTLTNREVIFIKDSRLHFDSASIAPISVSGDTLRWNIATLLPRELEGINIQFKADAPPGLDIGDSVHASASIDTTGDLAHADNFSAVSTITRGAFDPNDKLESHGGSMSTNEIADGKPLLYTIRFQNTGTDTAFNVVIRDTLDVKADWNSLQIIGSSHTYKFAVKDGKYCTWTFSNILLPDSNVNEPLSHGYISYRIKPKAGLVIGDQVSNTASIYFDFNLPVQTNTVVTEIKLTPLPPPAEPIVTGIQTNYCSTVGVQTAKITNLPAAGSGITVSVKIDGNTVAVGADSSFSFNVSTLSAGAHNITVQFSNATANKTTANDFTITAAVNPDVNVSANITNITSLATNIIVTAVNAAGGGSGPLYTFARDRNFTNIAQAESVNNTWTFNPSILAIGDNKIYVRMKSSATCLVTNTVMDSILLVRSSVTGITDPDMPGQVINIYPNPFKDEILINGLSTSKIYTVKLFNLEGKQLVSKRVSGRTSVFLTRQHQAAGIYWLSIYDEKRKQLMGTVKMMKQ